MTLHKKLNYVSKETWQHRHHGRLCIFHIIFIFAQVGMKNYCKHLFAITIFMWERTDGWKMSESIFSVSLPHSVPVWSINDGKLA